MLFLAKRPQKEKRELIVFRDWLAVYLFNNLGYG